MFNRFRFRSWLVIGLLLVAYGFVPMDEPARPMETGTITVSATTDGVTTTYIGATEAAGFWIDDLTALGLNTYRLWTKMAELEWWDDDDTTDGLWDDSEYGTPTIAAIKADAVNNFVNTVPWGWWDSCFDEVQSWRFGTQTRRGIIASLVDNDITPLVVLRIYDDGGSPEMRPGAQWAPRPPVDENFRNEWWEHCFAIAYWLNVRNNYKVTHFEVLNEPDYNCQGWCNPASCGWSAAFCGSQVEYAQLVEDAYDAINFANSLAGLPAFIHAPVVSSYSSAYLANTLSNADSSVQVVDYHTYASDPLASINSVQATIENNNPDGIVEPIWISEWGALWSTYNTFQRAMLTANQLLTFSEEEVEGITVFNMYDWSITPGQDYGLIDLQNDGWGGANRALTESYYTYRLMIRGLAGGKEKLDHITSGFSAGTRTLVTRDSFFLYVLIIRNNVGASTDVNVDLSVIGAGSGSAIVWEYSPTAKDVIIDTPTMSNGQFSFTTPADGISLARVERIPLAIQLERFEITSASNNCWILGVGILILIVLLLFFRVHWVKTRSKNL
jgi:hypothetical protein